MYGNPGSAGGCVHERVEQSPVGDRIAAVDHSFGFAKRRRNGAGIEVVAANDDRRFDLAALHQLVHSDAELGAFAVAEPADSGGQSLKMNSLLRQFHPAREDFVLRK